MQAVFSNPDEYPNASSAKTIHPLRFNQEFQRYERYTDSGSDGSWLTNAGTVWTPDRDTIDARRAFRRYKIPNKPDGSPRRAIGTKLDVEQLPSGETQVIQISPATTVENLSHQWYAGSLSFTIGSVFLGFIIDGVKHIVFTDGLENDWGDVEPNISFYPDYPNGPGGIGTDPSPIFPASEVAAVEDNMILLNQALIFETRYVFNGNLGAGGWNNLTNELVSLFWGTGYDVWASYTAWDELDIVRENTGLGFEKHLVLYEPRFFKYTKLDGTVIRDDTAVINEFAELLFELITKPRYFGSATLDVTELDDGAEVFNNRDNKRDIFMGSPIQIENWKPNDDFTVFTPKVLIQSIELSQYDTEKRISIGFDNPQTFIPLANTQQFRSFFEDSFNAGFGGTNSNGGCGCSPTVPSGGGSGSGGGGGGLTTEPPISTGTGTPPTTTPGASSTGTGATGNTSDTSASGSTTPDDGTETTTTETTEDSTTTTSSSGSASTVSASSSRTFTDITGEQFVQDDQDAIGSTTTSSTTTPPPAEQFTGIPFEDQES